MQDKTKDSWEDHEGKEDDMKHYHEADDAHFQATIPWWAAWRGYDCGHHRSHGSGLGTTGMILGIIAIVIVVLFVFGWFGFEHRGGGHERYGYGYGHFEEGYRGGGYGHNRYQDKCYELGDKLAQVSAERYADAVGWRVLDKANDYSSRELRQYAAFQSELDKKDQEISKLYTRNLFDKCVKEVPNMVDTKQIVAPIGPVVKPLEMDLRMPYRAPHPEPVYAMPPMIPYRLDFDCDKDRGGKDRGDRERGDRGDSGGGGLAMVNW